MYPVEIKMTSTLPELIELDLRFQIWWSCDFELADIDLEICHSTSLFD